MSSASPWGLLGAAPALPDLERRRLQLERRAEDLADERVRFLRELGGRAPQTPEQRARWSQLSARREVLELERDCLELERRRVEALTDAARAADGCAVARWVAHGKRLAEQRTAEAEGLLGQLRRTRRQLLEAMQRAAGGSGGSHG